MCESRITRRANTDGARGEDEVVLPLGEDEPRNSRAKIGMLTTPTAIMTCRRPGPSIATIPIAKSRPGIASMMSIAA